MAFRKIPVERIEEVVAEVRKRFDGIIGIHCHNDSDVAVANTMRLLKQAKDLDVVDRQHEELGFGRLRPVVLFIRL